jgi:esterase/lipase
VKRDKTPLPLQIIRWVYPKLEILSPFLARRLFIKIFFSPLGYATPEKERIVFQQAEKFQVTVNEKLVQCYSWGGGPVILLVHGWAGRATQFRKFIEMLTAEGFRVVGFDGPAHGHSQGRQTNIIEFAVALREVYKITGVPQAIIAHSFGGGAVLYAAMNGLPVPKLVNIASPTIGDEIISTYLRAIGGTWKLTGDYFKTYIHKTYNKTFDEFTALYFIRHIPQEIQLLLIHDEDDKEVSVRHAEELLKIYPKAVLFSTRGLGHTRILKDESVIRHCVTFIGKPAS